MLDVVIIGGGPAGLTAAMYAGRAGLSCVILEKMFCGGQMLKTTEVDNFPGVPNIRDTFAFSDTLREQAAQFGAEFVMAEVVRISCENDVKIVETAERATYRSKAVILATGAKPRLLGVPGEETFSGRGVSYCATCDGAFFKGKTVAVVGGGDTALEDALYLSPLCGKVYLIHRRETFRASKVLVERAEQAENICFVLNEQVTEILGKDFVTGVKLSAAEELSVDGVFVAVGTVAESEWLQQFVKTDESGAVLTDTAFETSVPGVFAAGDLRRKALRQIITACADGAECVHHVQRYLMENA